MAQRHRPLDSDGNPPMPGQMDIDEVLATASPGAPDQPDAASDNGTEPHPKKRPMTAAEVVAARLKGQQ